MGPLCLLLAALPVLAGVVKPVPKLQVPVSPTPALTQLRLDVSLLAGQAALSPNLRLLVAPAAQSAPVLGALPELSIGEGSPLQIDALQRLEITQQLLSRYEPETFAALGDTEREEVLAEIWDGWSRKGLADDGAAADQIILDGVRDKSLTSANKSVFLGVGVLGYPLEDALWLRNTRINDAIDENALRYPSGQKWHTPDGTPEFLGKSKEAQDTVDAWGAAADYAAKLLRHVKAGQTALPKSQAASPQAAMAFADLVKELLGRDDHAAADSLASGDPTLAAFLLDVRKPGYYLYNADESLVAKILNTSAAKSMGLRTVKKPDESFPSLFSTYVYRPVRVAQRLASIDPGQPEGALLNAYGRRLTRVARDSSRPSTGGWVFADYPPEELSAYPASKAGPRWELPASPGKRPGLLSDEAWRGLRALELDGAVTLVTDAHKTRGKVAAKGVIQVAALEELGRRAGRDQALLASLIHALLP